MYDNSVFFAWLFFPYVCIEMCLNPRGMYNETPSIDTTLQRYEFASTLTNIIRALKENVGPGQSEDLKKKIAI